MAGYIIKRVTEFVHEDDKCPSNCPKNKSGECAKYNSKGMYSCSGHRNIDMARSGGFETYGVGSVIDDKQHDSIKAALVAEINERNQHEWYSLGVGSQATVDRGNLVEHSQENKLNDAINAMNAAINSKQDWGISGKDAGMAPKKVSSGNLAEAENLKYLEQNILAARRDCVCYSDCTSHGKKTTVKRVWCGDYGDDGY